MIKEILKLSKIASKDVTRFHLNGVYLDSDKIGNVTLSVTDGYRLIRQVIRGVACDVETKGLIRSEHFATIKAAEKLTSFGSVRVESDKLVLHETFHIPIDVTVKYPSIPPLIPRLDDTNSIRVCVNAKYILELANAITADDEKRSKDHVALRIPIAYIKSDGEGKPVKVEASTGPWLVSKINRNDDIDAVVMPMRG